MASSLNLNTLDTVLTSFDSALRNSLALFSLCQCRYPKVWLSELPGIYIPLCLEFCLHARRVNEICHLDPAEIPEIVSHRLRYLEIEGRHQVDKNYLKALNRVIHSNYISLAFTQAADVEPGNELDQVVVAIEAESDRRQKAFIDLAGLVLIFRNEIVPRVQARLQNLSSANNARGRLS